MGNRWATRGRKPDRNVEAAAVAGGLRFLKAIVDGEPRPWISALSNAVGAGVAMDKHRIADRERANERNAHLAEQVAAMLNRTLDVAGAETSAAATGSTPASPTFQQIAAEWKQFIAETGQAPGLVELTTEDWNALSPTEQVALREACESCAARLRVDGRDLGITNSLLTR